MSKKFLTHIDLNKNQIQNALLHPLGTAPGTPSESQVYYDTTDKTLYLRNDSTWLDIGGVVRTLAQSGTNSVTIAGTASAVTIAIADATTSDSGLLSSTHWDMLDTATSVGTASTLVIRDASSDFTANEITANAILGLADMSGGASSTAATKGYVDTLVASGMTIKGSTDCSGDPNYPAGVVGDTYYVSVAGHIGGASGEVVEVADAYICITDNAGGDQATVGSDWFVLQSNIGQATDTVSGIVELATQAEVDAGTDADRVVTPETLAAYSGLGGGGTVDRYTALIGDNASTTITVTHGLNIQTVQTQVFDASTHEEVECEILNFSTTQVKVTFTVAPATDALRAIIHG